MSGKYMYAVTNLHLYTFCSLKGLAIARVSSKVQTWRNRDWSSAIRLTMPSMLLQWYIYIVCNVILYKSMACIYINSIQPKEHNRAGILRTIIQVTVSHLLYV